MIVRNQTIDELIEELGEINYQVDIHLPREEMPSKYADLGTKRQAIYQMLKRVVEDPSREDFFENFRRKANMDNFPYYSRVHISEAMLNAVEYGGGDVSIRLLYSKGGGFAGVVSDEGEGFDVKAVNEERLHHRAGGGFYSFRGININGAKIAFNNIGNSVIFQYLPNTHMFLEYSFLPFQITL